MKRFFKFFIFVLLGLALVACDTDNTEPKDEPSQGGEEQETPVEENTDKLVYVLEYAASFGPDVEFTYNAETKSFTATVDDLTGVVGVEFYLNNGLLSNENTTVTGVGSDASSPFYQTADSATSFKIGNAVIDDATFVYDVENKSLAITYNLIEVSDNITVTYQLQENGELGSSNNVTAGEGGKYSFDVTLTSFAFIDIYCNGVMVSIENTEISGDYANVGLSQGNALIFNGDGGRLAYDFEGQTSTYTFAYTPASDTSGAKLEIEYHQPVVEVEGFMMYTRYNDTQSTSHIETEIEKTGDIYTVTLNFAKIYGYVSFMYNGTYLTPDNTTFTGDVGGYGSEVLYFDGDCPAHQLNCCLATGTYVVTFDPSTNTVNVDYQG